MTDDIPDPVNPTDQPTKGAPALFGPILGPALAPTPRDPLEVLREQATHSLAVMSYHGGIWGRTMAEVGRLLLQAKELRPEEWDDFVESLGIKPWAVDGFLIMHEEAEKVRRAGGNAAGAFRRQ